MSDVVIRPVTLGDVASLRECVAAVAAEGRFLAFTTPFSFVETAFYVARVIDAGHPHVVACDGERVVGWCDVTGKRGDVYNHVGVLGMGVAAGYRGRGLGRRLITTALAGARQRWEQVELNVYASNAVAQALYRSVGFAEFGRHPKGRKHAGRYDDVLLMNLMFD